MKPASRLCLQPSAASNIHRDESSSLRPMAGSPVARQHPFGLGMSPIQQVMSSPCLSAAGIRFLQRPVPAAGLAFPCGRVTGLTARPRRGCPCSASLRNDRGRCLLYAGACGVCAGHYHSLFTCGSSPPFQPSFRQLSMTTRPAKVHDRSPCRSSPRPGSDDGYPRHWAFRPSFTPCRYQQRMWGWRPVYTLAGIPLGNHSREATSGRKIVMGQFWLLLNSAASIRGAGGIVVPRDRRPRGAVDSARHDVEAAGSAPERIEGPSQIRV